MAATQNRTLNISSVNSWPPSENTRLMLVELIISCLSSESRFSCKEEAADDAKRIEGRAFVAANHHASRCLNVDGSSILHFYAKEAGKQLLDALKREPSAKIKDPNVRETSPENFEVKEIVFNMLHFVFKRPEAEALEVMSMFSSALEGLKLRSLGLQVGEWGEKGVKAFGPLLKSQKMLEEFEILGSNISREAAIAICELLPSVERIKSLHFLNNQLGDDAAEVLSELIKKCIALEYFDFSESFIGIQGAIALVRALRNGSNLKTLDLSCNNIGKRGGVALRQVISGHLGLTEVCLSYMNLEDEGVIAIADSLKEAAPSLRVLTITGNNITSKAAPALAECLAVKKLLALFYADENELKDDGAILICKAISKGHEQLQELDLSTNAITLIGVKAVAEAVANKPNFSRLFISGNCITKKEIETVKDVMRKGIKGKSVLSI